jgi:RimJ/RimL family protein N-acetyltransferase
MRPLRAGVGRARASPQVSARPVKLVSVYRLPKRAPQVLYQLLQERTPDVNISHRQMPSWKEHLNFISRRPYAAWYVIMSGDKHVGAAYLTRFDEIGISILQEHRKSGYGHQAVRLLMREHPRKKYLANINPRNSKSIRLFERLGFRLIQHTYELLPRRGQFAVNNSPW